MEWIRDHLTESWLALAVVLGVAEMFSLDLMLIMLATGAFAGFLTSLVTDAVAIQATVALITAADLGGAHLVYLVGYLVLPVVGIVLAVRARHRGWRA